MKLKLQNHFINLNNLNNNNKISKLKSNLKVTNKQQNSKIQQLQIKKIIQIIIKNHNKNRYTIIQKQFKKL